MADGNRLAEVCALLAERDQEFGDIRRVATAPDPESGEVFWSLSALTEVLQLEKRAAVDTAVARAKVAAGKADIPIREHFRDGSMFDKPGEMYLSKYASYLFVVNCDPNDGQVGLAQVFFALQVDRQRLEDEKRLRTRLDVTTETNKLTGVAKERGVVDFQKFNGMGVQGLYGGLTVAQIKTRKSLPQSANHLDFAGSEELAANLFRITQTRAALARQGVRSELLACQTHKAVAEGVRKVIKEAGNTLPEALPACSLKIDQLATQTKRKIVGKM